MSKCRQVFWKSAITVITKDKTQILIWKSFMCSARRIFFTLMCQTHFFLAHWLQQQVNLAGACMRVLRDLLPDWTRCKPLGAQLLCLLHMHFPLTSLTPTACFCLCVYAVCAAYECTWVRRPLRVLNMYLIQFWNSGIWKLQKLMQKYHFCIDAIDFSWNMYALHSLSHCF